MDASRADEPRARDVRPSDVGVGVAVAMLVVVSITAAVELSRLRRRADVPPIDAGLGTPISIRPILDAPAPRGTKGGASSAPVVPRQWARRTSKGATESTEPSSATSPTSSPTNPTSPTRATSPGGGPSSRAASPPAAVNGGLPSIADEPDEPETAAPPSVEGEAPTEARTGSGEGAPEEEGPAGTPDGVLEARAIEAYRERLSRWLSARFTVTGSGLSRAALLRHRVRAVVHIGADGSVARYEVIPSGNAAFDEGARAALESVRGEPLPAPPDHYPGSLQRELKITFVCKETQCD